MFLLIILFHLTQAVLSNPEPEAGLIKDEPAPKAVLVEDEPAPKAVLVEDEVQIDDHLHIQALRSIEESCDTRLRQDIPRQVIPNDTLNRTGQYDFKVSWLYSTIADYVSNIGPSHGLVPKIIPPIKEFTISMWVRDISTISPYPVYLNYYTRKGQPALNFHPHEGTYHLWVMSDSVTCQKGYTVLKEWHHVAATWISYGGITAVYLDGEKLSCDKSTISSGVVIPVGYAHRMMLGLQQDASGPTGLTFTGDMAYVNIYSWFTDDVQTIHTLMEQPTKWLGEILSWDREGLTMNGRVVVTSGEGSE